MAPLDGATEACQQAAQLSFWPRYLPVFVEGIKDNCLLQYTRIDLGVFRVEEWLTVYPDLSEPIKSFTTSLEPAQPFCTVETFLQSFCQ